MHKLCYHLGYAASSFDIILCASVLNHILPHLLKIACSGISRVIRDYVMPTVPYKQDNQVGRTICCTCGKNKTPSGHVNLFDEVILKESFLRLMIKKMDSIIR